MSGNDWRKFPSNEKISNLSHSPPSYVGSLHQHNLKQKGCGMQFCTSEVISIIFNVNGKKERTSPNEKIKHELDTIFRSDHINFSLVSMKTAYFMHILLKLGTFSSALSTKIPPTINNALFYLNR